MKKWIIWGWILAALIGPANAAGTIPGFSLTPQFTKTGQIAVGCKLYTIQAGTVSTPQNSYQDSSLTILQPNPIPCDSAARLPQFFLADGQIKVRLIDANGVEIFVGDNLLVIGPSSGGGGGGSVDPTTVLQTGDFKVRYGTGAHSGFVRMAGRTIGSATSGATERANLDCQPLFEYLWGADANLAVSGGRGASANADWVANKTIALPDWRGKALAALDDMGNSAAGVLTGTYFGTDPTVLGAAKTGQTTSLAMINLPPITPSGTISSVFVGAQQFFGGTTSSSVQQGAASFVANVAVNSVLIIPDNWGISSTFTGTTTGGNSTAFDKIQPTKLATFYIKL